MWQLILVLWSTTLLAMSPGYENCLTPLAVVSDLPVVCKNGDKQVIHDLPPRILNWGSQGRGDGVPWHFTEQACNDYYIDIFNKIVQTKPAIKLSTHDLFHAHIVSYGDKGGYQALVFHAKEYPRDLEVAKNYYQPNRDKFSTLDPSYRDRNFVLFSQATEFAQQNTLYLVNDVGQCHALFDPHLANTLSEQRLAELLPGGRIVGDLNMFEPRALGNIHYNFFSQELAMSGKSKNERMVINLTMEIWSFFQAHKPLLYFMTGLGL